MAINCLELIFSLKTLIQQSALNCSPANTWREGPLPHSFSVYVMVSLSGLGSPPWAWPFCCQFMRCLCFQSYLCSNLKPNPGSKNDHTSSSLTEISGLVQRCIGCACFCSSQVKHNRNTTRARWWLLIIVTVCYAFYQGLGIMMIYSGSHCISVIFVYRVYRGISQELQSPAVLAHCKSIIIWQ